MDICKNIDKELEERFGVVGNILHRSYLVRLDERRFDLEKTTPKIFMIDGEAMEYHAWTKLIETLVRYLQREYTKPLSELYKFKTDWSTANIFCPIKKIENMVMIEKDLFVSVNFTATHSFWFINDLLTFYGLDSKLTKLIIHRPPCSEPNEVQEFIERKMSHYFEEYLANIGKTAESIQKILKGIKIGNKILKINNAAYNNFYLMDPKMLSTYKYFLMKEYVKKTNLTEVQIMTLKKYIDYYSVFLKFVETKITD